MCFMCFLDVFIMKYQRQNTGPTYQDWTIFFPPKLQIFLYFLFKWMALLSTNLSQKFKCHLRLSLVYCPAQYPITKFVHSSSFPSLKPILASPSCSVSFFSSPSLSHSISLSHSLFPSPSPPLSLPPFFSFLTSYFTASPPTISILLFLLWSPSRMHCSMQTETSPIPPGGHLGAGLDRQWYSGGLDWWRNKSAKGTATNTVSTDVFSFCLYSSAAWNRAYNRVITICWINESKL